MSTIKAIEVRLDVEDVSRSAGFYAHALGFEIDTMWPDAAPQFAIRRRDGLRLQLGSSSSDTRVAQRAPCTLWLDVAAIGELYVALQDKVRIEWGPEVYFYHRREFAFRDPDGHLVILSEVTDDSPTCEEA